MENSFQRVGILKQLVIVQTTTGVTTVEGNKMNK